MIQSFKCCYLCDDAVWREQGKTMISPFHGRRRRGRKVSRGLNKVADAAPLGHERPGVGIPFLQG